MLREVGDKEKRIKELHSDSFGRGLAGGFGEGGGKGKVGRCRLTPG